jgi:hypothetical protein
MADRLTTYKEYLDRYSPDKSEETDDRISDVEDPGRVAEREAERTARRLREALASSRTVKKGRRRSVAG